jgi:hypothetical protein
MSYDITNDISNKDMLPGESRKEAKQRYLNMYGEFESKLPTPLRYPSPERDDIFILDFAQGPCGLKAYGAEKFIAELDSDVLGYAAPRTGHAAEAIASLAEVYGKSCVFFAAASKQVTAHQAVVLAYDNCELRFVRIPAMPCLNSWIRDWAERFNATALPFGLANCPEVTAGLVNVCHQYNLNHGEPTEFFCAVSTGTMTRALQIGWPTSEAKGVAVARNIKDGEKGISDVVPYHKTFYKSSDYMPEFKTTATYDAKAYKRFIEEAKPGAVFINVGSDAQIENRLVHVKNWDKIDAVREWGDQSAFEYDAII